MRSLMQWFSRNRDTRIGPAKGRRRIDLDERERRYPIYAIGDVHGCLDELREAEGRVAADIAANRRPGLLILLGDYIDRGPKSSAVLDHLIRRSEFGLRRLPLCGNHDDLFLKFLKDPKSDSGWLDLGGRETLMSYGIDLHHVMGRNGRNLDALRAVMNDAVPHAHRTFLETLPISLKVGRYLFVHAGIRPGVPLDRQSDEDLLWIREPFLTEGPKQPLVVIHGHTPATEPQFGPGRIGMDTGAFFTGKLAVLKIEGGRVRLL